MGLVRGGGVKPYAQSIEGTKYETQLCPCMTMLDLNDPLAADADTLGESRLVELQLPAPVANNGAQIGGCANEHGDPKMSTFVDITICRRSLTMENVIDRRQSAMSAFVNNRKHAIVQARIALADETPARRTAQQLMRKRKAFRTQAFHMGKPLNSLDNVAEALAHLEGEGFK
jgi:hypothetical protein